MIPNEHLILLTIRPEHAEGIYSGRKKVELRKSFSGRGVRLMFLYETEPTKAFTGVVVVEEAKRLDIKDAISHATSRGVPRARVKAYFGERKFGWVIDIKSAIRFKNPMRLVEAWTLNHRFRIPQTFSYLGFHEGLAQELWNRFLESGKIRLSEIRGGARKKHEERIIREVGASYDDIDQDFAVQVTEHEKIVERSFSTRSKRMYGIIWNGIEIGFTVLTEKVYGAAKTGPTILYEQFRGLGFGQMVRQAIYSLCESKGFSKIYCTAPDDKPNVVSYVLNSGYKVEGRLREHLAGHRSELVFGMEIKHKKKSGNLNSPTVDSNSMNVVELTSGDKGLSSAIAFFCGGLQRFYFVAGKDLKSAIKNSLKSSKGVFSAKPRHIYACIRGGKIENVVLGTLKRSNMLKLNLVSDIGAEASVWETVGRIVRDTNFRRYYFTLPASQASIFDGAFRLGFKCEGVLDNPFGTGVDHICFGRC